MSLRPQRPYVLSPRVYALRPSLLTNSAAHNVLDQLRMVAPGNLLTTSVQAKMARVTVDWDLGFLNIEAAPVTPFTSYSDVDQSAFAAGRIRQDPASFNNAYVRIRTVFDRDSARCMTAYAYVRARQSHSPELQRPRLIFQVLDVFHVYGPRRERARESEEENNTPHHLYPVAHNDLKKALNKSDDFVR
ncbi:hypothetical protein K488DRAFT_91696 [Vararia minispora EC-137]|uniref:Uncharacterized protein n=1 Tax=Vararia minispora EC-137 TaxID=1314806 RepID=A0ACB8Q5P1_9AGAM|nr:hypothetical protein K488DRAFT_91696 [Vararia minispora EC-137]